MNLKHQIYMRKNQHEQNIQIQNEDQNTSILDVSTSNLNPTDIVPIGPERNHNNQQYQRREEDPFGIIDTSQTKSKGFNKNSFMQMNNNLSNFEKVQNFRSPLDQSQVYTDTQDGNESTMVPRFKQNMNQTVNKSRAGEALNDKNNINTTHFINKSLDFTSQANKVNQKARKQLKDGIASQKMQEDSQNVDTNVDTVTKNMLELTYPNNNLQGIAGIFQGQQLQKQLGFNAQKGKTLLLSQKLKQSFNFNLNSHENDRKIFESNPRIVARHYSIQTQLQMQNNVGLNSSPQSGKDKKRNQSVGEKLFNDLAKSHRKKLTLWEKCKRKLACICLRKQKKKETHQKDLLNALKEMTQKYRKKQQRTDQLWRKVRAFVRTGMFIQKVKNSTNSRMRKTQTGISERRQIILEKRMTILRMSNNRYLCLIKNNSTFKLVWEFVIAIVFIMTFWIIPLNIATLFQPYQEMQTLEILIDFVIIADICINFITEGQTSEGEVIIYLRDQAKSYLKSYFVIDVLSIVPLLVSWESSDNLYYFKLVRFIRIKRFFMFFKYLLNIFFQIFHNSNYRPKIKRLVELFKIVMIYYFIFHLHTCIWHYLGITNESLNEIYNLHESQLYRDNTNVTRGWISLVMNISEDYSQYNYLEIYLRSQYFIITSFATVGYGDIHATDQNEYIVVIYYLMAGQLLFSFFTGKLKAAMLKVDNLEMQSIKNEIVETVELFLMKFGRIRGARTLKNKEIKNVLQHVDASFQFNFKQIKKEKFYRLLSPKLKRELVFHLFGEYQNKFLYFFEDFDAKYKAGNHFIFEVLSNLQCVILIPGQIVINHLENFANLYFIIHGGVNLYDKDQNFLVQYGQGSNFGDFQLILGLKSQFVYRGLQQRTNYLLSLEKDFFIKALSQDYDAFCYLTKIALRRRKDLRRLAQEIQQKEADKLREQDRQIEVQLIENANKIQTFSYDSPKSIDQAKNNIKIHLEQLQNESFEPLNQNQINQESSFSTHVDKFLLNVPRNFHSKNPSSMGMSTSSRNDLNFSIIQPRKLKVLQLLQIRCQTQNNRFINYFLEDLNLNNHINQSNQKTHETGYNTIFGDQTSKNQDSALRQNSRTRKNNNEMSIDIIKEERKESSDDELIKNKSISSDSENDESFVQSDISVLNSEDEVSPEEEDEYTLPDGYKFYAERIGEAEHAFKKFKQTIKQGKRKFTKLIHKLKDMDKKSLQNARDTINLDNLIYKRIDSLVEVPDSAKDLMKKVTLQQFGGLINLLSNVSSPSKVIEGGSMNSTNIQKQEVLIERSSLESDESVSSRSALEILPKEEIQVENQKQEQAQYISLINSPMLSPARFVNDYQDDHSQKRNSNGQEVYDKLNGPHYESKQDIRIHTNFHHLESNFDSPIHNYSPGIDSVKHTLPYNIESQSPANISPFSPERRRDSSSSSIRGNIPLITDQRVPSSSKGRKMLGNVDASGKSNNTSYNIINQQSNSRSNFGNSFYSLENKMAMSNEYNQNSYSQKSKAESSLDVVKTISREKFIINAYTSQNQLFDSNKNSKLQSPQKQYGMIEQTSVERFNQLQEDQVDTNDDLDNSPYYRASSNSHKHNNQRLVIHNGAEEDTQDFRGDMNVKIIVTEVSRDQSSIDASDTKLPLLRDSQQSNTSLINLNKILEDAKDILGSEMQTVVSRQNTQNTSERKKKEQQLMEEEKILEDEEIKQNNYKKNNLYSNNLLQINSERKNSYSQYRK